MDLRGEDKGVGWIKVVTCAGKHPRRVRAVIRTSLVELFNFPLNFSLRIYFFFILSITFKRLPTPNSLNLSLFQLNIKFLLVLINHSKQMRRGEK
jgi:hypothetical protein